jgi:uncharacterized protein with FMN-binding domain
MGKRIILTLVFLVTLDSANGARASQAVPAGSAAAAPTRSKAEVEDLIKRAGATAPDWWDAVPLNFPKTLDLTMTPPPKGSGWDQQKNVGQYFWSVINENSSKWKEGVKLAHHLMILNEKDPKKVGEMQGQMAHLYEYCLCDYARAAFWRLKRGDVDTEDLAVCYWKLGSKEMAKDVLSRCGNDDSRHGTIIKLWADLGEFDRAMKEAEIKAQNDRADIAYLMAGEACRTIGRFADALKYYEKVLACDAAKAGRDFKQSKSRAQASIDAIKVFDTLDLKRIPDGVYKNSSVGYTGPVNIELIVKNAKIEDVKVTQHAEKQYYASLTETPRQIVLKQGVKGVDTYSSATITSEAIINACAKALAAGMK